MKKRRFQEPPREDTGQTRFDDRIRDKKGRPLLRELLKRQPNTKTLTKKEFDLMLNDVKRRERVGDNPLWTYENLNNMPYDFYNNLSRINKAKVRETMTTPEGFGLRKVKNLTSKNKHKFVKSTGRKNKWVSFGRQRNVKLVNTLPFMRFKPIPVLNRGDRIANKVSNFMTFVDNAGEITPTLSHRFNEMKSDILRFIGEDKYLIKIIKKDFKGVEDGIKETMTLPINPDGLDSIQAWITDIFDGGSYEEGAVEFGDYQIFKDHLEVSFYKLEKVKDKRTQFFNAILKKNYDLSVLQIYKSVEESAEKYKTHCLVHACEVLGVPEKTIIRLKHCIGKRPIGTKDYPRICNILQRNIRYVKYPQKASKVSKKIKSPTNAVAKINADKADYLDFVFYKGHIMANIKLPITTYSIKNYEDVKDLKDFHKIIAYRAKNKTYSRSNKITTTTSLIIKALMDTDSFDFSFDMAKSQFNIDVSVKEVSADLYHEQRPFRRFEKDNVPLGSIYYADLESLTNNHINSKDETTASHRNFMSGYVPHLDEYKDKNGKIVKTKPHIFRSKNKEDIKHSQAIYQMLDHIRKRNNKFVDIKKTKLLRDKMMKDGATQEEADKIEVERVYDYILYFHNLKYDFVFIKRLNLQFTSICEKAGAIYSVSFIHKGSHFTLKDSLKILPFGLAKFKDNLQLDVGKLDFEMYDYFNEDNLNNDEEIEYKGQKIKPLSKYIKYLELDCITLKAGVRKLYESLKSFDEYLNIYNFLTISSLAYDYFGHCGGWTGLYELSGSVLNFVNKSQVGGRCCLKDNKKIVCNPSEDDLKFLKEGENYKEDDILIILDMLLEDFDMKSCYPSAIKISKLPVGYAKKLKESDLLELNNYYENIIKSKNKPEEFNKPLEIIGEGLKYSHIIYDVDVKFSGYLQIPILSVKKESGTRLWTNDINETITISSVYLKDIIDMDYYKIESINIKHGIYWDSGYNMKCQEIIQRLYNERLEYKDEKSKKYSPCMSECLKLILNSIYGKCGLKASETEIKLIAKDKLANFLINNHEDFIHHKSLNDRNFEVKIRKNTYEHYNMTHISSLILENSKILMNHVIKSAQNIGCFVGYTDTDSFHLDKSKIKELVVEYRRMFQKELIGEQLTQFSVDFAPVYVNDVKYKQYSRKFLCPALKWYMDDLEHVEYEKDVEGNIINSWISPVISKHVRNKGCDRINIEYYNKVNNLSMTEFYLSAVRGDTLRLDLCKGKTRMDFKSFEVYCKEEMIKEFKF
jgi:hypothetical protein